MTPPAAQNHNLPPQHCELAHRRDTLIFASGLSVAQPNSFSRQLRLTASAVINRGFNAVIVGIGKDSAPQSLPRLSDSRVPSFDLPTLSAVAIERLCSAYHPHALILLGYVDQFAFLAEPPKSAHVPTFLWSQVSAPPVAPTLRGATADAVRRSLPWPFTAVPLTEMTRVHLLQSKWPEMGPTIPHGVDTEVFRPTEPRPGDSPPDRPLVVGTVGANTLRKRFDVLFAGIATAEQHGRRVRLLVKTDRVRWAGGFNLDRLVEAHRLGGSVDIITGELPEHALAELYRTMDLYVHTAEWEGFGVPVIEAMACGVPVAAPPVQGPSEILPYTDLIMWDAAIVSDGPVVLRHTRPSEVARIVETASNTELMRRLSERGLEHVRCSYAVERIASAWVRLVTEAI